MTNVLNRSIEELISMIVVLLLITTNFELDLTLSTKIEVKFLTGMNLKTDGT